MLEDARPATEFAGDMLEKGIYAIGFSFPVVPKGVYIASVCVWEAIEHWGANSRMSINRGIPLYYSRLTVSTLTNS